MSSSEDEGSDGSSPLMNKDGLPIIAPIASEPRRKKKYTVTDKVRARARMVGDRRKQLTLERKKKLAEYEKIVKYDGALKVDVEELLTKKFQDLELKLMDRSQKIAEVASVEVKPVKQVEVVHVEPKPVLPVIEEDVVSDSGYSSCDSEKRRSRRFEQPQMSPRNYDRFRRF